MPKGLFKGYRSRLIQFMFTFRNVAITTVMFWLWLCCSSGAYSDSQTKPDAFINPLEITTPDPLLPGSVVNRPLTLVERINLTAALDKLNLQAEAKLNAEDRAGAFEIWNRELRLRRVLGSLQEVEALGRVGAIAWNENQKMEVQFITKRLQTIQEQIKPQSSVDLQLLSLLGSAFGQVRSPELALSAYEQILTAAQRRQDVLTEEATMNIIGELHLIWFNYPQAAAIYNKLLNLATAKNERVQQLRYLQQLAFIYERAKQYQQAVVVKQQLAKLYLNEQQLTQIPALRLTIASDYEKLKQIKNAFQNYQEAYASAWSLQQYYIAGDALRRLVVLYLAEDQTNEALKTSEILLEVDKLASDLYGLMNTYDQIGQIHLKRGNNSDALLAFQQGLELAKQLSYQEAYFAQKISQTQQTSK